MTAKKPYSPGYLELTMHQFAKNKLAVFGVSIIMFLFFVACYAPVLTNNKPLAMKARFEGKYEDQFYALLSNISIYASLLQNPDEHNIVKAQTYRGYINRSFKRLRPHIPIDYKDDFSMLRENLFTAFDRGDFSAVESLSADFENTFFVENITIDPAVIFPAIDSLSPLEVFFIVLYPLVLIFVVLKNLFRNKLTPLRVKNTLVLCLLISLTVAVVWRIVNPPVFDPTNYKRLAQELSESQWVIFPPVPYGENENLIAESSMPPTWLLPVDERTGNYHLLGTDTNGRDALTRMIMGTRISMSVGFIAVGICLVIGIFFGSLAGYFRGKTDIAISRLIEIVICFPVFFLILTVLAFLRPSIVNIMVVIGVTGWTGIARLCRGEFLKLVKQDFVTAANALGAAHRRIIFKHILPNGMGPILVSVSFGIAGAILTESALSFLGFGVPQPTASWGDLLNNGRNDIQGTWWLTIFPGLAIFIAVTAFNLAGEGLRDALDPRLKKQ